MEAGADHQDAEVVVMDLKQQANIPWKVSGSSGSRLIHLRREPHMPIGLDLDLVAGTYASVVRVLPEGVVKAHNDGTVDLDQVVQEGDAIFAANSARDDVELIMQRLWADSEIVLDVYRPTCVQVCIPAGERALGLQLRYAADGRSLLVTGINSGRVADLSDEHPDRESVHVGDRIVQVN
eukprot:CAMPEP_0176119758 /NCGR_PEP_ID=MMETSP0120_2-20121206/60220_1 /TAXON_ID=160619 /ORGANISM="Kryptoperidinium foliaceum, Strain CCMP 1326" /LENGTH=179 /DNA_ID=CAMNT_0017454173 /DNA_START=45 /DNA_END=581 /DNA_ORIENTATION=-